MEQKVSGSNVQRISAPQHGYGAGRTPATQQNRTRDAGKRNGRGRRSGRANSKAALQKKSQEPLVNDSEDGWRYDEIFGTKTTDGQPKRRTSIPNGTVDLEDNWRWKEILSGETIIIGGDSTGDDDDGYDKGRNQEEEKEEDAASEDGWRYDEIFASSRTTKKVVEHRSRPKKNNFTALDMEDNWRWKEVFSGSVAMTPREPRPSEPETMGTNPTIYEAGDFVDSDSLSGFDRDQVQAGDLVRLIHGGGIEKYRGCCAIVKQVAEAHCTVAILDEARRFGIGECWPGLDDVIIERRVLRVGTRIVIDGMKGTRRKHYNGLTGVIREHPRQGHPVELNTPAAPDHPLITVCIVFDDPDLAGERSALIEPRFLTAYDEAASIAARCLQETVTLLTSKATHMKDSKIPLSH